MVSSVPKKKNFPPESARDDWVRMTLRLPPELHREIAASAGALSMNAAIVQRLIDSFLVKGVQGMMDEANRNQTTALRHFESANDILEQAVARHDEGWNEGFKEGRKQSLDELKKLIEDTVEEAVRKSIAGKL